MSLYRKLLHESGKNHFHPEYTPTDPSEWPESWKTVHYKEYKRFSKIDLLQMEKSEHNFFQLLSQRKSHRKFSKNPLDHREISHLLKYSCGEFLDGNKPRRVYPSGGARYPIEMYLLLLVDSDELKAGVYHYNVKNHTLEWMWEGGEHFRDKNKLFLYEWAHDATALFVLTGLFWRSEQKYNHRGSRYAYLEAGHIAQNLHLTCDALGLKSIGLGGVWDDQIEQLLALDTRLENFVHAVAVGK